MGWIDLELAKARQDWDYKMANIYFKPYMFDDDNMIEQANRVYGRNYSSFSRRDSDRGVVLEFVGIGVRTTVLEKEFKYIVGESRRKRRENGN